MMKISVLVLYLLAQKTMSSETDNSDLSRTQFEYEYKVLGKLSEQELELVSLKEENGAKDLALKQLYQEINILKEHAKTTDGSVYIRWGRTDCLDSGTRLVYKGYAGGSHYTHKGGAANHLCLPAEPTWDEYDDPPQNHAFVFGTEFEMLKGPLGGMRDHEVPCAVCRSNRPTMVMIPGRTNCTDSSWTMEYSGYLVAGHYNQLSGTEYICLDGNLEAISIDGNKKDANGNLLYYVEAHCGALQCPPYVSGRALTCVVCTK